MFYTCLSVHGEVWSHVHSRGGGSPIPSLGPDIPQKNMGPDPLEDQTGSDIIHPPPHQKSGQYASYWNAVLFSTAAEVVLPNLPHADKMQ